MDSAGDQRIHGRISTKSRRVMTHRAVRTYRRWAGMMENLLGTERGSDMVSMNKVST